MANRWLASGGAWGTAANWQPDSTVPVAADGVIIPAQLSADVTDAGGDAAEEDFASVHVHKGYTGSFGSSGAPIQLAADLVQLFSSGPCYLECDLDGTAVLDIDELIIALARSDVVAEIGGHTGDAGEIDLINILRGRVTLKANINFAAASIVRTSYMNDMGGDVNLTIAAGAETLATFEQDGGHSHVRNQVTKLSVRNGTCLKDTTYATACHVHAGGVLQYEHIAVAGDNTSIYVYPGGLLDLMTNAVYKDIDNVYIYPGGDIKFDPALTNFSGTDGLVDMRKSAA